MADQVTAQDIALMAHLMRRAGFGARYDDLVERAEKGYEATVEELLNPESNSNGLDLDLAERCFIEWSHFTRGVPEYFAWRLINSRAQLEEKMVLFWHSIFCTADSKVQSYPPTTTSWKCSASTGWAASATCWLRFPKTRR